MNLSIQPWALGLPWFREYPDEGDPRCLCSLCSSVIGAAPDDARWRTHDDDCVGCALCEIAVTFFRGKGKACLVQRYHFECFLKVCRPRPRVGPAEASS
jgi:hypothetical protein